MSDKKEIQVKTELVRIPEESLESSILIIRGQMVILDQTLAELYGVSLMALNQAVKRNLEQFPSDFMFRLTMEETRALECLQSHLKNVRRTNAKYLPHVFTEHGILTLSGVLRSGRAKHINIQIVRTFIRVREILASSAELTKRLYALERSYDGKFRVVYDPIRQLLRPRLRRPRAIGF